MSAPTADVRERKKSGREEVVQDMLAALIVGGDSPRWNAATTPTERGIAFLRLLTRDKTLGAVCPVAFVSQFELPKRHEDESSGWPSYAFRTADQLIMVELKTDSGSHHRGEIAHYFELSAYHYPALQRRLIYVTPTLRRLAQLDSVPHEHLHWTLIAALVQQTWQQPDVPQHERQLAASLLDVLTELESSTTTTGRSASRFLTAHSGKQLP